MTLRFAPVVACSLLLLAGRPLLAQGSQRFTAELRPAVPTTFDDLTLAVTADVNGVLCGRALTLAYFAPQSKDLVLYAVTLDSDVACPAAVEPFTFEFPLGKLAAGAHTVGVSVPGDDPQFESLLSFQVAVTPASHVTLHGRFDVAVQWQDFAGGQGIGRPVPRKTRDSALLWFFAADNWEMLVKVLDGCAVNGHWWILGSGATNVPFTLYAVDRDTGVSWQHENASGHPAGTFFNTRFSACP